VADQIVEKPLKIAIEGYAGGGFWKRVQSTRPTYPARRFDSRIVPLSHFMTGEENYGPH
jgi:hypothetical protein